MQTLARTYDSLTFSDNMGTPQRIACLSAVLLNAPTSMG
jgi:hypothetical protein